MPRIGIVANEVSGDLLGAGLIRELRRRIPDLVVEGVGGPEMIAAGCRSLLPMERLSVMGLVEVLRHLPELLLIRRRLRRHFLKTPPDLFIGIDAPDFNLGLEASLKAAGIPTAHYVCPSVWAWRPKRVEKIRVAADLVLSLFPFEKKFLKAHGIASAFVGHTLADEIPMSFDRVAAQQGLGLGEKFPVLALLPGSRMSEIRYLADDFIRAAELMRRRFPDLAIAVPLVSPRIRKAFEARLVAIAPDLPMTLVDRNAREVLGAADLALVASGTATLEALLLKRPMVVAYRVHPLTYRIVRGLKMLQIEHVSLANLLVGREVVAEFIQDEVTPEQLSQALQEILANPKRIKSFRIIAEKVHRELRQDAAHRAANALIELMRQRGGL